MLNHASRWSHAAGNEVVPSPWQATVNEPAARAALEELVERWGTRYLAIIRLWNNAWEEFIPFLDYGACRRIA
jgi:putative transposase